METPPPQTDRTAPTDADIAAVQATARPPAARPARDRAPLPLRQPGRGRDGAAAEDGTPFPTMYYLTCPRAASAIGTLEADGVMKEMTARLAERPRAGRRLPRRP